MIITGPSIQVGNPYANFIDKHTMEKLNQLNNVEFFTLIEEDFNDGCRFINSPDNLKRVNHILSCINNEIIKMDHVTYKLFSDKLPSFKPSM